MQENNNIQIVSSVITLILVIIFFENTNADIWIQNYFYNFQTNEWIINKNNPILKLFFYDGIKKLLILFAVSILLSLVFFRKKIIIKKYKKGLIIVLLSAIFIPLFIGSLKAISNTPCPCNIIHFNGKHPNIKVFENYPKNYIQTSKNKCWPAGHASGGFALMSLFFLFKSSLNKKRALTGALIVGWSMGTYKMVIGDHFISHTIITMILAWIITLIISKFIEKKEKRKSSYE